VSKKKHLPEFDPLAGEGQSSPIPIDSVHVPISSSVDMMGEGTIVAEYRLENIYPDFFQSRGGVLPRLITKKLQEDKIDQREALADWRKLTTKDEAQKRRYDDLVKLKESIRQNGLINPIHITSSDDENSYRILCGERRYWAYWLLNEELEGYERIPAIHHSYALRFLQIAENDDVEPLSAVSKARQTALAYLELLGIRPLAEEGIAVDQYWDFYRKSLKPTEELIGTTYRPRGFWKEISERLGLHRTTIIKLLEVLRLPGAALDLADLWNVSQIQLESILAAPEEIHQELVEATITLQLPSSDIVELAKIAKEYGLKEYRKALTYFREEKVIIKPSGKRKRVQRPPEERYFVRIVKTVEGVSKYAQGDYGQIARLIVGNKPDRAQEYARELNALAKAIRAELRREQSQNR
jgi:ParB-like chromosome segregation protein Spo0J